MRNIRPEIWACSLALASHAFLAAQESKPPDAVPDDASISGTVVERNGGSPVQGANVMLMGLGVSHRVVYRPGEPMPPMWPTVSTDAEGKFHFTGLAKGRYLIRVEESGHAATFYRSNPNLNEASNLDVAAGAHIEGLTIYMVPGARLSGKVTTGDGRPVGNAEVACLFKAYRRGLANVYPTANTTTNGAGEYAFDSLSPGEYYLFVTSSGEASPSVSVMHGFYPSGGALDSAIPIAVNAGINIPDANITLKEGPSHKLSGEVLSPASEETHMIVELHESSSELSSGPILASRSVSAPDYRFSFEGVISGQYMITVRPVSKPTTLWFSATVFVSKSDISNLRLNAGQGVSVTGVVKADSKPPFSLKGLSVRLTNIDLHPSPAIESHASENGSFALRELSPGRSILEINGLPKSWYVKCIGLSRQACSPSVLNLTADVPNAILDVTIASPAASVSGQVIDDEEKPVPMATVVLWPDRREDGPSVTKSDGKGSYAFQGLAPGSYTLQSWTEIEQFRAQDPKFKSSGETVHVNAGDSVQKDIVAAPAASAR